MPETSSVYFAGFFLSASLIIAIGAQNAHVLRQGLKRKYVFVVAALCAVIDMVLITLGTLGFGTLIGSFPLLTKVAAWGGAAFLVFYGFLSFRSALRPQSLEVEHPSDGEQHVQSLKAIVLLTLAVSLLNPHVYLDTIVLIGGIAAQYPLEQRITFALGASTASVVWFFSLAYGARLLQPLFQKPAAWRILDTLIGLIMWGIAVSLVIGELS